MATIVFYEKPGCRNNRKQKKLLAEAGHEVVCRNLGEWQFTPDTLRPFLHDRTPEQWINTTHPALKSGELTVDPSNPEALIQQLCEVPLLIKRPLMEIDGRFYQGFDALKLNAEIGLSRLPDEDIETCPHEGKGGSCGAEEVDATEEA